MEICVSSVAKKTICAICGLFCSFARGEMPPIEVEYFFEAGCPECAAVGGEVLPPLLASYGELLSLRSFDISVKTNYLRLAAYQEHLKFGGNEPVSMVVDRQHPLLGLPAIRRELSQRLALSMEARLDAEGRDEAFTLPPDIGNAPEEILAERMGRFALWAILLAGLADGLNPCAFAMIVFLASLLSVGGRGRRGVFLGGISFCVASFVTYFLIGLGMLTFLRQLEGIRWTWAAIRYATATGLLLLAFLSFRDAWRYGHTGKPESVSLKLPKSLQRWAHGFARSQWQGQAVFWAGFLCGVVATAISSVCTGQLYLPTIVLMTRSGDAARARLLLFFYNCAFMVPLVAVFLAAAFGVRSQRLADWTRRHVVPSKILLGIVFVALALFFL